MTMTKTIIAKEFLFEKPLIQVEPNRSPKKKTLSFSKDFTLSEEEKQDLRNAYDQALKLNRSPTLPQVWDELKRMQAANPKAKIYQH